MRAEQVTPPLCYHAEGPVWWSRWSALRWVDMYAGDVLEWRPDSGAIERRHVGTMACALRPRKADGGMVVARGHDFVVTDGEAFTVVASLELEPGLHLNDGACDPSGRFLCGSFETGPAHNRAKLYALGPDRTMAVVLEGISASNGLCWTGDGSAAYYVDSRTWRVDAFDYEPSLGLHNRRPFATVAPALGGPDGITVDAEGGVWVAVWGGGVVHRYSSSGEIDFVVDLPARHVTACTFGGPDLDVLYVTTSRCDDPAPSSAAGAVFACVPGVLGLPTREFHG